MRSAAKELEFERAAALRDEIQGIRLRVLEQDQSVIVGQAAERRGAGRRSRRRGRPEAERRRGGRGRVAVRGDERHGPAGRRGARGDARRRTRHRREHGRRLAARDPRRARRRHGLAGPLARPAHVGSDGDAERPAPDWDAAGTSPPLIDPGAPSPAAGHAGSRTANDRRIRPRARQIRARVASSVRPSCEAISRVR